MIPLYVQRIALDILQKTAASRWRQAMRAGGLGADDVARLKDRGLLNYAKEVAGLERGNAALARKLDVPVQRLRDVVKDDIVGGIRKKDYLRTAMGVTDAIQAPQAGGAVGVVRSIPGGSRVIHSSTINPAGKGLKGEALRGQRALMRRHELDEVRAGQKLVQQGGSGAGFVVTRPAEGLAERISAKQLDAQRAITERLSRSENAAFRNAAQGMDTGAAAGLGMPISKLPRGHVPAGRHIAPNVITRESANVAMLPPEVRQALGKFRKGEQQALGQYGFEYGKSLPKSVVRKIDRAYGVK
jgi:hypothetical protein